MSTAPVATPVSNPVVPVQQGGFVSILDHFGAVLKEVFVKGLPAAEDVAKLVEPIVAVEFPAVAALFNTTLQLVSNAQATGMAAAAGQSTGAAKLAVTVPIVETVAAALLKEFGVTIDSTIATAWTNAVVDLAKLLPAPANSPANTTKAA